MRSETEQGGLRSFSTSTATWSDSVSKLNHAFNRLLSTARREIHIESIPVLHRIPDTVDRLRTI